MALRGYSGWSLNEWNIEVYFYIEVMLKKIWNI